jgi:hypothetical protein
MKAVESYYTVQRAAVLLDLSDRTIKDLAKAGKFGREVVDLGTETKPDLRIPASGINGYLHSRRLFSESVTDEPIAARTVGELRRKGMATG